MRISEHMRTVVAVLLLSVVLPMTLVLPYHRHEAEESARIACERCEHHQPHPAHLSSAGHADHCLICQFLGGGFLPEALAEATAFLPGASACVAVPSCDVPSVQLELLSARAPPYSFC